MKREACALMLLLLLCTGAALNIRTADQLIHTVELSLDRAESAANRGDYDTALQALCTARAVWDAHERYTLTFLRHPDVDSIGDAFFEVEAALRQKDGNALPAFLGLLRYHLDTIARMEHPNLGSIF